MMSDEAKIITDELKKIEENLADIQLILENETNKNIRLIAEGRFDRSRKPDGALKAKKEMLHQKKFPKIKPASPYCQVLEGAKAV